MKKTFITKMPDQAGALLKASQIITAHHGNIDRISYNKTVDVHTLFLDVSAEEHALQLILQELTEIGYFHEDDKAVILIELRLHDVPGILQAILEILAKYAINISYISSTPENADYQRFRLGLFIENTNTLKQSLQEISQLCHVQTIDYTVTEKQLDSTVFYLRFATEMRKILSLSQSETSELIINSNKIMHILESQNEVPQKTFDFIKKFASFIVSHKGEYFNASVHKKTLSPNFTLYLLEPPCGSNTFIFHNSNTEELLFVDGGFCCFMNDAVALCKQFFPHFDSMKKTLLLTHGDIDHCGLAALSERIYLSADVYENFRLEHNNKNNFRESNALHGPYCKISRLISQYVSPDLGKMCIVGKKSDDAVLSFIGKVQLLGLDFDVYQGDGGHVRGESIWVCEAHKIVFTGDNLVNVKGFSPEQYEFNLLAPYLMASVNMDSEKASACRKALQQRFQGYTICPGHGHWIEA